MRFVQQPLGVLRALRGRVQRRRRRMQHERGSVRRALCRVRGAPRPRAARASVRAALPGPMRIYPARVLREPGPLRAAGGRVRASPRRVHGERAKVRASAGPLRTAPVHVRASSEVRVGRGWECVNRACGRVSRAFGRARLCFSRGTCEFSKKSLETFWFGSWQTARAVKRSAGSPPAIPDNQPTQTSIL